MGCVQYPIWIYLSYEAITDQVDQGAGKHTAPKLLVRIGTGIGACPKEIRNRSLFPRGGVRADWVTETFQAQFTQVFENQAFAEA